MSEITIDPHTLRRAQERGVSIAEIKIVICEGNPMDAARGRMARWKVFDFDSIWSGRFYDQKKVVIVYLMDQSAIITVTVYAFYGRGAAES